MVLNAANTEELFYLVPFVVFIPRLGLLINIIIGGKLGEKAIGAIACLGAGLSFVVAVLLGIALIGHPEGLGFAITSLSLTVFPSRASFLKKLYREP